MNYPNPEAYRQATVSAGRLEDPAETAGWEAEKRSDRLQKIGDDIVRLSQWIDAHPPNAARDPEAATWGRVAKVSEECGEVIAEMIAWTGQNPRKTPFPDAARVLKELTDVVITALGAIEHITGHRGKSVELLEAQVETVIERAGLD